MEHDVSDVTAPTTGTVTLAQIREEVGSPAIAHAILLIGDGLYFDAALTGGSLSTQVAQVAVDELLPVIDHLLELGRR